MTKEEDHYTTCYACYIFRKHSYDLLLTLDDIFNSNKDEVIELREYIITMMGGTTFTPERVRSFIRITIEHRDIKK